jgi:DNA-binding MarR family transcriptional regulator
MPISALLSQALVAFTIEFDNETEKRMPHRTTNHGATPCSHHAPWLVSLAMWSNCMQFIGDEGVSLAELETLARTAINLHGMMRWGYIVIERVPGGSGARVSAGKAWPPRRDSLIRATQAGREAQKIWRPMFGEIEKRWEKRFGKEAVSELRESLSELIAQFNLDLPDCLPILGYGLFSGREYRKSQTPAGPNRGELSSLPLSALLSKVLLAFAIAFERDSELSLAISANVIRVLDERGVAARELPRLAGVSKEAIKVAAGVLQKSRYIEVLPDPSAHRSKLVRLTPKGLAAQKSYHEKLGAIEARWNETFGKDAVSRLRKVLETVVREPSGERSRLFLGLESHPDGWRASVSKPETLPHFPMVLHRGGFPDGS